MRLGAQIDMQGLIAGTPETDRRIGYLCKYLTKSIVGAYDQPDHISPRRARHIDRLAEQVRWLPCSPQCPNWLRYGIQPKGATAGMRPGYCGAKAHDREHLGLGGRRVLVSRLWTGKTLDRHRADRSAVVRAALEEAGIEVDDLDELSADVTDDQGHARYLWIPVTSAEIDSATYVHVMVTAITQRQRWREQYAAAPGRTAPHQFGNWQKVGEGDDRMTNERYLTVKQAAAKLNTSERFPRRLIAERRITFVRIGRHVRIPESALDDLLDGGTVQPVVRHYPRGRRTA